MRQPGDLQFAADAQDVLPKAGPSTKVDGKLDDPGSARLAKILGCSLQQFVRLALQELVNEVGLKMKVNMAAAYGPLPENPPVRPPRLAPASPAPALGLKDAFQLRIRVRGLRAAALFPLPNGLNITSDLIQVRKVVTGQHSQHHAQGLRAALIVLAGALQIRR